MARSRAARMVVISAPTSTTNITGFFIISRGFSLTNESPIARFTIGGSNSGRARAAFFGISEVTSLSIAGGVTVATGMLAPQPPLLHQEMFHHGSERKRREEGQRAHDQHHAHQQRHEQRPVRGERPGRNRH